MAAGLVLAGCSVALAQVRVPMHARRWSASDLEIGGELAGVAHGKTEFVSYADLMKLPLETYTVTDDTNFGKTVRITGVAMERLPSLLGAKAGARMVTAVCDDDYAAHYTEAYLKAHHPLLVLRVNGREPAHWPVGVDGVPMGPYMVSHARYTPSWQVLAHKDEAQVPWGVVRLEFRNERQVYAPITPFGPHANDLTVQQGFTIAKQNCFRCHARDGEGGTKSNRSWGVVARRAETDPQWFNAYVLKPKSMNAASQMAASPQYDAATLSVLRSYFAVFGEDAP